MKEMSITLTEEEVRKLRASLNKLNGDIMEKVTKFVDEKFNALEIAVEVDIIKSLLFGE